jgi:Secretion system C-terminal sorting domain/Pregnancy-associated plasma protein-A/GEVED domain
MKKKYQKFVFYAILLASINMIAQDKCGADKLRAQNEAKNPSLKLQRQRIDDEISNYLKNKKSSQAITPNEIPVIIHVLESSADVSLNPTDTQIQTWLDNTNKVYACTYGAPFANAGTNEPDGTVIPIKFVLAKRTPNCQSTTGIRRVNGSSLAGYDGIGFSSTGEASGVSQAQIQGLSNNFDTSRFVNIYIVTKIDSNSSGSGLGGFATLSSAAPSETGLILIRADYVRSTNADGPAVLAHEGGHYFNLYHTFEGTSPFTPCAPNGTCTVDGDKVCDTTPIKDLVGQDIPSLGYNDCTSANFDSTKFNIMGYGNNGQTKFTPGQRDRLMAYINTQVPTLVTSQGALPITTTAPIVANCVPTGSYTNASFLNLELIKKVTLRDINHTPSGRIFTANTANTTPHIDYTSSHCFSNTYTLLNPAQTHQLTISHNFQKKYITVWIDFNNDGTFTSDEKVASENIAQASDDRNWTPAPITIPATANQTATLRMRINTILNSDTEPTACGNSNEAATSYDYALKIGNTTLSTEEFENTVSNFVVYPNPSNAIFNIDTDSNATIEIYDVIGKKLKTDKIETGKSQLDLSSYYNGIYFLKITNEKNKTRTVRLVKK